MFNSLSSNLGALEMLAMEMKAAGMYVSRGLSFREAEVHTYFIRTCFLHKNHYVTQIEFICN